MSTHCAEEDLQTALDLLGKWLVAKNFRSHCIYGGDNEWTVELYQNHGYKNEVTTRAYKSTKSEAILEALKNAK